MSLKLLTEHHSEFLSLKGVCSAKACMSLHLSNCNIAGNHMSRLISFHYFRNRKHVCLNFWSNLWASLNARELMPIRQFQVAQPFVNLNSRRSNFHNPIILSNGIKLFKLVKYDTFLWLKQLPSIYKVLLQPVEDGYFYRKYHIRTNSNNRSSPNVAT